MNPFLAFLCYAFEIAFILLGIAAVIAMLLGVLLGAAYIVYVLKNLWRHWHDRT